MSENEEDFAAMFEASVKATRLTPGQAVEGTIVAIGDDVAFVNVGAKGEATIALDELRDEDGALQVGIGDRVQATLTSTSSGTGGLTLSRKLQRGAATARQLEDAFRSGLPVEGKVDRAVKAGYEVSIARQRAFCPMSQIDIIRHADPDVHVGRVYTFKIIEYQDGGRKFVVSRRALLEAEQKARAAEVRQHDHAGRRDDRPRRLGAGLRRVRGPWRRRAGTPARLRNGMVTRGGSVAGGRTRPGDHGQGASRRREHQQIALGLKQLTADPWSTVQTNYEIGQVREGRVTRIAEFGAFVELEPGIEALAHASTFPPTGKSGGWSRSIAVGMTGAFEVLSVDPEKKRIGVAMVEEGSSRASAATSSQIRDRPRRAFHRQGRAPREVRRVRVSRARRDGTSAPERDRCRSRAGHSQSLSSRQRPRGRHSRSRSGRPQDSVEREGHCGRRGSGGGAPVHRARARRPVATESRLAGRQAPRRTRSKYSAIDPEAPSASGTPWLSPDHV